MLFFSISIAHALDSTCFESLFDFSFVHLVLDTFLRFLLCALLYCFAFFLACLASLFLWVFLLNLSLDVVQFFHLSFSWFSVLPILEWQHLIFLVFFALDTHFCLATFVDEASSWRWSGEWTCWEVHYREDTGVSRTWEDHSDVGRSAPWEIHKRELGKILTLAWELESKRHHSFILWFLFWMSRFLSNYFYYFSFLLSFGLGGKML